MSKCVLVLGEASPHDQPSSSFVNLVPWDTRLENREGRVVCLSCCSEHALHSFWHDSGSDEVVSLNVATISIVLDAKVQLDKISPPDPSTIVADVAHWIIADQHGGTAINSPGRAELPFPEKLVHSNLLRLSLLDEISQLGRRSLTAIPDYLIIEFLLSDCLGFQTSNDGRSMTIPLDNGSRSPCQIAEPKILGQRVLIALPGKRDPHVNTLLPHGILDELELPAEKLHPERRAIQLHVDAVVTTGLIILPDL